MSLINSYNLQKSLKLDFFASQKEFNARFLTFFTQTRSPLFRPIFNKRSFVEATGVAWVIGRG
jgi:hypothetical protein